MKKMILLFAAAVMSLAVYGQQVPQFGSDNYADWVYSNPNIELNSSTILGNRIVLYTNSMGYPLTLTSPQFQCYGRQTINMTVTWITDQWQSASFNKDKVGLTAALLDSEGAVRDSVTVLPDPISRTNTLKMSITVPLGMTKARLRFASWKGDVNSNGAVRRIVTDTVLRGDVNQDGEVSVADINAIIEVILGKPVGQDLYARADVNEDKEVSLADVNDVVGVIFGK